MASTLRVRQVVPLELRACESAERGWRTVQRDYRRVAQQVFTVSRNQREQMKIALATHLLWGMILAVATGAFSSVGRALARQAKGHRFESCNAHHFCRVTTQVGPLKCPPTQVSLVATQVSVILTIRPWPHETLALREPGPIRPKPLSDPASLRPAVWAVCSLVARQWVLADGSCLALPSADLSEQVV